MCVLVVLKCSWVLFLFLLLSAVLFTAACTILFMHLWMPSADEIFVSLLVCTALKLCRSRQKAGPVQSAWVQIWSHIIYISRRLTSAETLPRNQRERSDRGQGLGNFSHRRPVCLYIVFFFIIALLFMCLWHVASVFFITNTVCSVAKIMLPAGLFSQCFCYKYSFVFFKLLIVSSSSFWSDIFQCCSVSKCDMQLITAFFKKCVIPLLGL